MNQADVKVLIDNDQAHGLEVLHKPGVQEPMHSHPAYVSEYLSASKVKVTLPDGKVAEKDRKAGETQRGWMATPHRRGGGHLLLVKGGPERVLDICRRGLRAGAGPDPRRGRGARRPR